MFASAIWLVPQIADVSICCGLKEDASEVQIKLVAAAIASKFKYLKTDEVISRLGFTNNSIAISTHRPLSEACQHFSKNVQTSLKNMTKN